MTATNQRKVSIGGLMRCCLLTLSEEDKPSKIGDKIKCLYCNGPMVVDKNGVWKWDHL